MRFQPRVSQVRKYQISEPLRVARAELRLNGVLGSPVGSELVDAALQTRGIRLPVHQNCFLPIFVRTRYSGLVAFLPFPSNHKGCRDRARGRHPR